MLMLVRLSYMKMATYKIKSKVQNLTKNVDNLLGGNRYKRVDRRTDEAMVHWWSVGR